MRLLQAHPSSLLLLIITVVVTSIAQEQDVVGVSTEEKGSHQCPQDPSFSCNDDQTCCLLPKGEGVGCCPYKDATCCKDRTHCCPHGLTCDIKAGRCLGASYSLLFARMLPAGGQQNLASPGSQIKLRKSCSDPEYSCDDSQTCCPLDEGGFGCCPLGGDAVCCPDKENCCPHGYVCDTSGGTCSPRPEHLWSLNP